jgi:glycerate 2-kinase
MNIVIAPDSFKGSLSSLEAATMMQKACLHVFPEADVILKPMADGGEGTLDTLLFATKGNRRLVACTGPRGESIHAPIGELLTQQTAIIEVATVAGLTLIPIDERDPYKTTTYGIGELIRFAVDNGWKKIIVCLGGSGTNDGGLGMLQALGVKFFDQTGTEIGTYGADLLNVHDVDVSGLHPQLSNVNLVVACDVDNPLCGPNGASAVYGPQKGATTEQIEALDEALHRYATLLEDALGVQAQHLPGAGAAGGLGFALMMLGANMQKGAQLVGEHIGLEQAIQTADLVITGEGKSDKQTFYGKAPGYVAMLAQTYKVPTILISGSLDDSITDLHSLFAGCFSIVNKPMSLVECIVNADNLLYEQTINVMHIWKSMINR